MCFQTPFLEVLFLILFRFCQRVVDLGAPSKSSGRRNGTKTKQLAPKWCPKYYVALITLYLEKRECMQKRQVDWTFGVFFFFFP